MKKSLTRVFIVVFLVLLTACGKTQSADVDKSSALAIIENEFDVLLSYSEDSNNPIMTTISNGFNVEIKEIRKMEDAFLVQCTFSNYDVKSALEQLEKNQEITLSGFIEKITNILKSTQRIHEDVELIICRDENGELFTQFSEEQLDIAMGGFLSFYAELVDEEGGL